MGLTQVNVEMKEGSETRVADVSCEEYENEGLRPCIAHYVSYLLIQGYLEMFQWLDKWLCDSGDDFDGYARISIANAA